MTTRAAVSTLSLVVAGLLSCGRTELLEPRKQGRADASVVHLRDTGHPPPPGPDAGPEPGPDASGKPRPDAGGWSPDAGGRPDAGPKPGWDAGTCTEAASWKLVPRAVDAVRLAAEGFATPRQGSSVTLEVDVQLLSGCEEVAGIDVELMPGDATDFVTLSAFAWVQYDGACEPVAPVVTTGATVPGRGQGNLRVVVADGHAPGGGLRLTYEVAHCSTGGCWCSPGAPPGDVQELGACDTDCDCSEGLSCLPALGPTGALWTCKRPCSRHTDCPDSGCSMDSFGSPWICGGHDACPVPEDCPAGFSCVIRDSPSYCEDQRQAPTKAPCLCDAECPPGQRCVRALDGAPTCEIPCADDQDCPFDWMVCGTPWICL